LVDGGWLIVGHAEPSLLAYRAFATHTMNGTIIYQKTGKPTPIPAAWESLAAKPNDTAVAKTKTAPLSQPKQETMSTAVNPPRRTDFLRPLPPNQQTSNQTAYDQARVCLSDGRVDEAVCHLKEQLQQTPAFAPAHCLLARAYADQGLWQLARQACEQARTIDPLLSEVYYVLAMVEEHEGHIEPAIENLKKLVYLDKERPLAYFNLAMLYKKRSQVGQAQLALKNTIKRIQYWPADKVIPDSGHTSAQSLAEAAQKLLAELDEMHPETVSIEQVGI
jgi:chemotaxis protein methyltransferase CheR